MRVHYKKGDLVRVLPDIQSNPEIHEFIGFREGMVRMEGNTFIVNTISYPTDYPYIQFILFESASHWLVDSQVVRAVISTGKDRWVRKLADMERITPEFIAKCYKDMNFRPVVRSYYGTKRDQADPIGLMNIIFGDDWGSTGSLFTNFVNTLWGEDYISGFVTGYDGSLTDTGTDEYSAGLEDGKAVRKHLIDIQLLEEGELIA